LDDAARLLAWRNDPETRRASHDSAEVTPEEHRAWLERVLHDPDRRLWVVRRGHEAVGTVRADRDAEGTTELSWTVAPGARGQGLGKRMVALVAARLVGPLRAEVKRGNTASGKIAEAAGMHFEKEVEGVLHFRRAHTRTEEHRK
jgi:RimJ/RimL family protein N-acetyltransferase